MSKLLVINEIKETKVPFLRGMLVRSLQEAGLEFSDAYTMATDLRNELDETAEITVEDLRKRIKAILTQKHPDAIVHNYQQEKIFRKSLSIIREDGSSDPFSRRIHYQRLANCTIPPGKCLAITRKIHSNLVKNKIRRIDSFDLTVLTYQTIRKEIGQRHADYYLMWRDFLLNGYPLLLLIGGVPGCGKSTIATEIGSRLGIVRTQSTDMLREVMRIMIPKKLSPSLHTSSFQVGRSIKVPTVRDHHDDHLLYGFQMQSEMVEVACEAVIQRALNENVSLIVEGVHIRPSILNRIEHSEAVIVPVCLAAFSKKRLIKYIKGRADNNKQRRAKRYLNNLDDIWQLQSILLSESDHAEIEIIDNQTIDETVSVLINVIVQTIHSRYRGKEITALRRQYS
ncbi:MAG: hypothetical protein OXG56_05615 [Gammaproteobacteria bacterium]|nr:hypothetical protein [Gammaproteobacteria bacterium]